jgi:hypothetical protein
MSDTSNVSDHHTQNLSKIGIGYKPQTGKRKRILGAFVKALETMGIHRPFMNKYLFKPPKSSYVFNEFYSEVEGKRLLQVLQLIWSHLP